ncbi:MAG: hypothetical protein ACHQD9_02605, partial [Chitinophagales bacterium]
MSKKKRPQVQTSKQKQPQKQKTRPVAPEEKKSSRDFFFVAAVIVATIIVYAGSLKNGWTNWDDEGYVLSNDLVKSIDLKAIFSSFVMGNYHPITVLFQAIEFHFFGKDASGFHTVSLLLHMINSLLLFYFVRVFFKNSIAAFIAALLFAIHPLHVESVSWVAAQK